MNPKTNVIKNSQSIELNFYTSQWAHARTRKQRILCSRSTFYDEFAAQIDLMPLETSFPDWIYKFREERLRKMGTSLRKACQSLKTIEEEFLIFYPIQIDGSWKYADIFVPKHNLVILLRGYKETVGLPCFSKTNRELWFGKTFDVLPIESFETGKLADKYNSLIDLWKTESDS